MSSFLLGLLLRYFGSHFWGILSYSQELFHIFLYKLLYLCFLYYTDRQCAKKSLTARIPILVIFPNVLRNLKFYLDILKNVLILLWIYFMYIPQCLKRLKIFSGFFCTNVSILLLRSLMCCDSLCFWYFLVLLIFFTMLLKY